MKNNWLLPVGLMAFLLLAVGVWGYGQYQEREQLQIFVGNQYSQSFYNLVDRMEDVTAKLGKSIVSTGREQLVTNLAEVWRQATSAQEVLNQLPISNATLTKTSKFLTQTGDYCRSLSKANIPERNVTEEERDKLQSLREQSANLSQALHDLESEISKGSITWGEITKKTRQTIDEEDQQLLSNNFENRVQNNEPFPVLVYDGPFSDHINQEEPKGLTGATINEEEAQTIATRFCDYKQKGNLDVKNLEDVKGKIPAYQYSVQPNGNDKNHTTIDITKKGGHVTMFLNPRNVGQQTLSRVEGLKKGETFLKTRGYENMVPTYSWIEDNTLTISYAYMQDQVIVYPDLIKLKVALDDGQVIGFEALGYIMSHRQRKFSEVSVTKEEIEQLVQDRFTVDSIRLALIPTPGLKEILTWEARVNYEEETYLLYYDVTNGDEVNILKVIDAPEGTFAE